MDGYDGCMVYGWYDDRIQQLNKMEEVMFFPEVHSTRLISNGKFDFGITLYSLRIGLPHAGLAIRGPIEDLPLQCHLFIEEGNCILVPLAEVKDADFDELITLIDCLSAEESIELLIRLVGKVARIIPEESAKDLIQVLSDLLAEYIVYIHTTEEK
jgi:hypothetical protein